MNESATRPEIDPPEQIATFVAGLRPSFGPFELWLFGSRARDAGRPDSDWDLLAVVPDEAPECALDPVVAWESARTAGFAVTLLVTRKSELESIWGLPNTIGYDLARDGVKIRVG